ncbi:MAG: hypothetical protein ACFNM4_06280, partial [Prevotella nigrescens]
LTSVNLMADKLRLSDLVYHDGEYEKLKEENELLQKKVIELEDKLRNSKGWCFEYALELLKHETYQVRMFATTYWVDGQQKIMMHIAF